MRAVTTLVACMAVSASLVFPASAALDHNDVFSCYAYVHEQCFPGGKDAGCGEDSYNDALDECDGYYESKGRRQTVTFTAPVNPQLRTKIMKSFTKK